VLLVGGHPRAADQVGIALDGDDLIRPRRWQDVLHDGLRRLDQGPVVIALGVGEAGDGNPRPSFSSASVTRFSGSARNSHSEPRQDQCT